jgi:hypothetical protein
MMGDSVRDMNMYTPRHLAIRFRQYSCGRERYDMRFIRVNATNRNKC